MDDYYTDEDAVLSPEEQEKIRVFSRLAGGLIITAWVFMGALVIVCCCASILACLGYRRVKRRVYDQEKESKTHKQN